VRALLLILVAGAIACAAVPVWIDTDPSVARGGHEVDDGLALIQAFHSSVLAVRGVSVVFGNAPLSEGFSIERRPDDTVIGADPPGKPYLLADLSIGSMQSAMYCFEAPDSFQKDLLKLLEKPE
jgi:hypothetical protein